MSTTLFALLQIESASLVLFFDEEVDVNINGRKELVFAILARFSLLMDKKLAIGTSLMVAEYFEPPVMLIGLRLLMA